MRAVEGGENRRKQGQAGSSVKTHFTATKDWNLATAAALICTCTNTNTDTDGVRTRTSCVTCEMTSAPVFVNASEIAMRGRTHLH